MFFFNDTAPTEISTLSLHDALPISSGRRGKRPLDGRAALEGQPGLLAGGAARLAGAPSRVCGGGDTDPADLPKRRAFARGGAGFAHEWFSGR